MFWRKKINSDEYQKLYAELANLVLTVQNLQAKVVLLEEKFLSRIKAQRLEKIKQYEEQEDQEEEIMDPATAQRRLLGFK